VPAEAAIDGKVDYLRGLKENAIMGRLVPADRHGVLPLGEDRGRGRGGRGARRAGQSSEHYATVGGTYYIYVYD